VILLFHTAHAPTEDKNAMKDSFYKELESVLDQVPKYNMKLSSGYFSAKLD